MLTYNLADLFEALADAVPERLAVATSAGEHYSYQQMDQRSNRLAHALARWGVTRGDRVAVLASTRIEWADALLACFKLRAMPVNVNYRYTPAEMVHVLRDSEPAVVLVEQRALAAFAQARPDLSRTPDTLVLTDIVDAVVPDWAAQYDDEVAASPAERDFAPRSSDDQYLLYTGGTTGMPKGVLWTHENLLFGALGGSGSPEPPITTPSEVLRHVDVPPAARMTTAPLMHGAGQWSVLRAWSTGGTAVLWTAPSFDPEGIWTTTARERVVHLTIVGDVMARPLVETLRAHPARWDLDALTAFLSGGAVLSDAVKQEVSDVLPGVSVVDGYGASEAGWAGSMIGVTASGQPAFDMKPGTAVLDEELHQCPSGQIGLLAISGHVPEGYWRNDQATAQVFKTDDDGTRWVVPGDNAVRNPDGTITLLGRGSLCINTGGEKVFPDEIETVLKSHPAVVDALVVGVPDAAFGEQVAAVVALRPDMQVELSELQEHARTSLAGYKVPRRLTIVDAVRRSPAGKADYTWARAVAREHDSGGVERSSA